MIEVFPIPAFNDNYIWIIKGESGSAVVVDPGDATPVLSALRNQNLNLAAVLITHHHPDHTGGLNSLLGQFDVPVYGPKNSPCKQITNPLVEGSQLYIDEIGVGFDILEVPGHTLDHVAYYRQGMLFCGDTLFAGGCGGIFEGTAKQMHASLSKINALPKETLIYCAHEYTQDNLQFALNVEPDSGDLLDRVKETGKLRQRGIPTVPSDLDVEQRTNPFLRYNAPSVIQAAEKYCGGELDSDAAVFACVRSWKDDLD